MSWGVVGWPGGGRAFAVVLRRPKGAPLALPDEDSFQPVAMQRLVQDVVQPVAATLGELASLRISHRGIRPSNIFAGAPGTPAVLGECVTTPAGFAQPVLYEPPERALAVPSGRG